MRKRLSVMLITAVLVFLLMSAASAAQDESLVARIQIANLTDDILQDIDVYMDGELLTSDLPPGEFSSFLSIPPGEHEIHMVQAGESLELGDIVFDIFNFAPESWSHVVMYGSVAGNFVGINAVEQNVGDPSTERVFVYLYNPALEGEITALFDDRDPIMVFPGITVPVEALVGSHTLSVSVDDEPYLASFALEAEAYHNYFVTVSRGTGTTVIEDTNLSTTIRVNHLVSDLPPLALLVDGQKVASVVYESRGDAVILPYGTYTLALVEDDVANPETYYERETVTLDPGTTYTITFTGLLADNTVQFTMEAESTDVYVDNEFLVAGKNAVINVRHAISDAPPFDILLLDGTVMIQNLAFRDAPAVLDLPAGNYDMLITAAGDPDTILFDLTDITLKGGNVYTFYAIGTLEAVQDGSQWLYIEIECVNPNGCE